MHGIFITKSSGVDSDPYRDVILRLVLIKNMSHIQHFCDDRGRDMKMGSCCIYCPKAFMCAIIKTWNTHSKYSDVFKPEIHIFRARFFLTLRGLNSKLEQLCRIPNLNVSLIARNLRQCGSYQNCPGRMVGEGARLRLLYTGNAQL